MSDELVELVVEIEVGGDHGDGNVVVVRKSKGVKVIIRDFDNAMLPENADEQDIPEPEVRELGINAVI